MILSFFYWLFLIIIAFFKKRDKVVDIILILSLYLLLAFEHSDQDYVSYLTAYEEVGNGRNLLLGYEPAFLWFCEIGNYLNLTFDQSRAFICILEILAIISTIKLVTPSVGLVLSLFFVYPCMQNAELFRWMFAMCIIIYALRYIIRGHNYKDYTKYIVLVLVASSMHTSCLFFLLFLLSVIDNKKIVIYVVLFSIVMSLLSAQLSLFYRLLGIVGISEYMIEKFAGMSGLNIFGLISMLIKDIFIFYIGYIAYGRAKALGIIHDTEKRFTRHLCKTNESTIKIGSLLCAKLYDFNIISLILFAIGFHFPHAQRLLDVLLFINLLAVSYLNDLKPWRKGVQKTAVCILVVFSFHIFSGSQNMDIFMSHFREGFIKNFLSNIL